MYFIKQVFLFKIFFSYLIPEEYCWEYTKNALKELKRKVYYYRSRYKQKKHLKTEDELLREKILNEIAKRKTVLNE